MPIRNYISCCMITLLTLVACKKKDSYDITGDPEVKFFTNHESPGDAPPNSIGYEVVNVPNTAGAGWVNLSTTLPAAVKFPVMASAPVSQEVTIRAELDNSLIDKYNADHNTNYLPFPDGFFNTGSLSARIAPGATRSTDSISMAANLSVLGQLTGKMYMAPIKLSSVSNPATGNITSNTTTQVTYVVAKVEQRQIKYNAPSSGALGSLVADRSAWTATLTPDPISTSGGGSILDGSTSSYSRWGESPGQVDINMQSAQAVSGIRIFTYTSSSRTPTQVEVYLSDDGINYNLIGAPMKDDMEFESNYQYILFYKAITAKYIRLKLYYSTSTSSQNRRIAELDVYTN